MADFQKLHNEMAQLLAEARRQIELRKNHQGSFNSDAFEARLVKALAEARGGNLSDEVVKHDPAPVNELLFAKSNSDEVAEFRKFNDDCVLLASVTQKPVERLDYFRKNAGRFARSTEISKAMAAATVGSGNDWVPTEFSADLYDRVRIEAVVAEQFPSVDMPTNPYALPTGLTDPSTYIQAENTSDSPTNYTLSTPASGKVTLTATKLTTHVLFSDEFTEDAVVSVLEFLKAKLAYSMGYAVEDALLNGDTTATHMDADVTSSADPRKAWKGIRRHAIVANDTSLAGWAPSTAATGIGLLRSMRGKMGRYGALPSKLAFFVGPKGLINLLNMPEIMTLEKFGPSATIVTGELGKVDGVSVIVSEKMREDVNASGFNDSTTNAKGVLLLAYKPGFVRGLRRGLQVRPWQDPRSGTQNLVQDWRGDFQPVYTPTTEPIAVKGINWTV